MDFGSVALAIPSVAVTPDDPVHIVTRSARSSPEKVSISLRQVSSCLRTDIWRGVYLVAILEGLLNNS